VAVAAVVETVVATAVTMDVEMVADAINLVEN
jgi:hypothetical protein